MTDTAARKKYRLENGTREITEDFGACLGAAFETIKPKHEVWAINLDADQGTGKTTFCRAFTRAVFAGDTGANPFAAAHEKTDNITSPITHRQVRLCDTRAFPEYSVDRIPLFGGYDLWENSDSQKSPASIKMYNWGGKRWIDISFPENIALSTNVQSALNAVGAREIPLEASFNYS